MLYLIIGITLYGYVVANKFGYDLENGPDTWQGVCKTGKRQSPIDIRAFEIEIAPLASLLFKNYEHIGDISLANNGHTIIGKGFENWGDKQPYISDGGLNGTYHLSQFHFHWSQQNNTGSEHTIASLHYSGELHLVHKKKNPSPNEVNIIAVVAVFLELNNHAEALENLKPYIQNLREPETESAVLSFTVNSLLPVRKENFYRYDGSLTTPGCDEAVVWTVMADPIAVSPSQMHAFHRVHLLHAKSGQNWRPTQSLNGRKILFRPTNIRKITYGNGGSSAILMPLFKVLMSIWLYEIYQIF